MRLKLGIAAFATVLLVAPAVQAEDAPRRIEHANIAIRVTDAATLFELSAGRVLAEDVVVTGDRFTARRITLTDYVMRSGGLTVELPSYVGSDVSGPAALLPLVTGEVTEITAAAYLASLAEIDYGRLEAAKLVLSEEKGPQQVTENLVAERIADGRAAVVTTGATTVAEPGDPAQLPDGAASRTAGRSGGEMVFRIASSRTDDLDIVENTRYLLGAAADTASVIFAASRIDGITLSDGGSFTIDIASIALGRTLSRSPGLSKADMDVLEGAGARSPGEADGARIGELMDRLLSSAETEAFDVNAIRASVERQSVFELQRFGLRGASRRGIGEIAFDGLVIDQPDTSIKLDLLRLSGLDFGNLFSAVIGDLASGGETTTENLQRREALPYLASARVEGLNLSAAGATFSLASLSLTARDIAERVPGAVDFALSGLDLSLVGMSGAEMLTAAGYERLTFDATLTATLDRAAKRLTLENGMLKVGPDVGTATYSARFGGATTKLFVGSEAEMREAGMALTLERLALRLDGPFGLADKLLGDVAKAQNMTADTLATSLAGQAISGLGYAFGNAIEGEWMQQVLAFAKTRETFAITIEAVANIAPLTLADLAASADPSILKDRVKVKIEAK